MINPMTIDPKPSWTDRIAKFVQLIGGIIAIVLPSVVLIPWWAGGIRLGSQVTTELVTQKLDALQSDLNAIKIAINGLPLVTQRITDQESHLSHIDGLLTALEARITQDELLESRNGARIDNLYVQPDNFRQPRH